MIYIVLKTNSQDTISLNNNNNTDVMRNKVYKTSKTPRSLSPIQGVSNHNARNLEAKEDQLHKARDEVEKLRKHTLNSQTNLP